MWPVGSNLQPLGLDSFKSFIIITEYCIYNMGFSGSDSLEF